jgi:hypothetical protein
MQNILLLGAGFSKNWGAPITSEFFNALIADRQVKDSLQIHDLLWANRENFEYALAGLQEAHQQNPTVNRDALLLLQGAISRVFEKINRIFSRQSFDTLQQSPGGFTLNRRQSVGWFLSRFDAIFTLNQDLLLEIHYFDQNLGSQGERRWNIGTLPGLQPVGAISNPSTPWSSRNWVPTNGVTVSQGSQPYYKLHGSTNWRTAADAELTIMGTGKLRAIRENPLLDQYHHTFADFMRKGNTRLTVIGYGFRDDHINKTLQEAVSDHGLQMFIVDPRGASIAYEESHPKQQLIPGPKSDFEEWFQKGLYSASTTPFRRLMIDESLDREVLEDFLIGK